MNKMNVLPSGTGLEATEKRTNHCYFSVLKHCKKLESKYNKNNQIKAYPGWSHGPVR